MSLPANKPSAATNRRTMRASSTRSRTFSANDSNSRHHRTATVQVFDRSPICTLALAHYIGQPVTPVLAREVDRVVAAGIYQPRVFFVQLLGFITPTAARRITLAQSIRFERFHEQAYRDHGFELVDVPVGTVQDRVQLVDCYIRSWSE